MKYETLLTDPAEFVASFSELSGIVPNEKADDVVTHLKVRQQNFQKYKTLPQASLAVAESVLQEKIKKYGYEMQTSAQPLSKIARAQWRFHDVASRIPQKLARIWQRKIKAA